MKEIKASFSEGRFITSETKKILGWSKNKFLMMFWHQEFVEPIGWTKGCGKEGRTFVFDEDCIIKFMIADDLRKYGISSETIKELLIERISMLKTDVFLSSIKSTFANGAISLNINIDKYREKAQEKIASWRRRIEDQNP